MQRLSARLSSRRATGSSETAPRADHRGHGPGAQPLAGRTAAGRLRAARRRCSPRTRSVVAIGHGGTGLTDVLVLRAALCGALVCVARVVAVREDRLAWRLIGARARRVGRGRHRLGAVPRRPRRRRRTRRWPTPAGSRSTRAATPAILLLLRSRRRRAARRAVARRRDRRARRDRARRRGACSSRCSPAPSRARPPRSPRTSPIRSATCCCWRRRCGRSRPRGWRPDRQWLLLGAGLLASGAGDTLVPRVGRPRHATWRAALNDILWPRPSLLIGWAAWQPRAPRRAAARRPAASCSCPPASRCSALALLIVDHFDRLSHLAIVLAAATLLLAVVRMGTDLPRQRADAAGAAAARRSPTRSPASATGAG